MPTADLKWHQANYARLVQEAATLRTMTWLSVYSLGVLAATAALTGKIRTLKAWEPQQ